MLKNGTILKRKNEPSVILPSGNLDNFGMRVLCEIRLSYEYSGNSDQSGRVISTADSYIGDIVWNANNFQYLQLQSVGKLYNLECRVQMVYRNTSIPPKPVFIPPRGIFQCKVRLLAV